MLSLNRVVKTTKKVDALSAGSKPLPSGGIWGLTLLAACLATAEVLHYIDVVRKLAQIKKTTLGDISDGVVDTDEEAERISSRRSRFLVDASQHFGTGEERATAIGMG